MEIDKLISEEDFRPMVLEAARLLGWEYYFTWTSIHSPAGFPDLVLVRPPRVIFAELKPEKGKLDKDQLKWMTVLQRCPKVEYYLWRPRNWDTIVERLK